MIAFGTSFLRIHISYFHFFSHYICFMPPLAERLRPQFLKDVLGQEHLTAPKNVLHNALSYGNLHSIIFWGPPGTGKTTLANVLAKEMNIHFFALSAVSAGVKDVREVLQQAAQLPRCVLFIDEIHRFNKGQQDALLHAVEKGIITLLGATTENPSFEVNSALLSRCQVLVLKALNRDNLESLLHHAIKNDIILKQKKIILKETEALIRLSGGDARKLLNLLEICIDHIATQEIEINNDIVLSIAQEQMVLYDKSGEMHYDIISAFIKSMRGSDPNASVYYLARMIQGGEDVKFIARRMLIFASEDIGNANPNALLLANACFDAVSKIGYPESRIILSQCAVYLATSVKSNASYMAIEKAMQEVKQSGNLPVPLHIRNAPTKLMKELGYHTNYQYDHNAKGNFAQQEFMPEQLIGHTFYIPGNNAKEKEIEEKLKKIWKEKYGY